VDIQIRGLILLLRKPKKKFGDTNIQQFSTVKLQTFAFHSTEEFQQTQAIFQRRHYTQVVGRGK